MQYLLTLGEFLSKNKLNMENRDPTLCREFVKQAKEILSAHPQIKHEWSIDADEDHCILDFPKSNPDGFDITVEVYPDQIIVFGQGFHEHFDQDNNSIKIESSLGLVRDLLCPDMRIKEYLAGGSPYRWDAELLQNGKWLREHTTGLVFWNYFGRRSQKYYQNKVLEGRLHKK